jgi:hypothetical protein
MKYLMRLVTLFIVSAFCTDSLADDKLIKDNDFLYIATFNVYKLGGVDSKYTSLEEDISPIEVNGATPQRIKNIANILAVGEFDLVALQEVAFGPLGELAILDLVKWLKSHHGLDYRVINSQHIGRGLMAEMITFLYNPNKVIPNNLKNGEYSQLIEIPGRDLVTTSWTANHFDFTLISAHLAWGNEEDRIAGYQKIDNILKNPNTYSNDPDIIILGDFNRFGDSQTAVKRIHFTNNTIVAPNITIFDPHFNSIKQVEKSHIIGKGIPDDDPQLLSTTVAKNSFVYDAFIMTKDVEEELELISDKPKYGIDFGVIAFDQVNGFGFQSGAEKLKHNPLKEQYSDHRPLWMRFKTTDIENSDKANDGETTKFVTSRYGKKYHVHSCSTLKNSNNLTSWGTIIELENNSYSPCKICIN